MVFQNNVLSGASGSGTTTYAINQSIRFDDAAEHFMYSPTPSSSKDFTTTATISFWFKLGNLKAGYLAGAFYGNNNRYNILAINSDGQLLEYDRVGGASTSNGTGTIGWTTTRVFRDPSAWYHIVVAVNTEDGTSSNRIKLYVNGVDINSTGYIVPKYFCFLHGVIEIENVYSEDFICNNILSS